MSFTLEIHGQPVGVVYELAELEKRMSDGGGAPVAMRLGIDDVTRLVVGPQPSSLIELHLTAEASRRVRTAIPPLAETLPFRVRVDERELFVGVVYTAIGAAAIRTPVLHVSEGERDSPVVLVIGAQQGAAYGMSSPEAAKRTDRSELRQAFRSRGKLEEREQPLVFRRDPR